MMDREIQDGFLSCLHFCWSAGVAEPSWRVAVEGTILPSPAEIFLLASYPQHLSNGLAFRTSLHDYSMWTGYAHTPE